MSAWRDFEDVVEVVRVLIAARPAFLAVVEDARPRVISARFVVIVLLLEPCPACLKRVPVTHAPFSRGNRCVAGGTHVTCPLANTPEA